MATMTTIEDGNLWTLWECSACGAKLNDRAKFEDTTKVCPKCGETITEFVGIYENEKQEGENK